MFSVKFIICIQYMLGGYIIITHLSSLPTHSSIISWDARMNDPILLFTTDFDIETPPPPDVLLFPAIVANIKIFMAKIRDFLPLRLSPCTDVCIFFGAKFLNELIKINWNYLLAQAKTSYCAFCVSFSFLLFPLVFCAKTKKNRPKPSTRFAH